MEEVKNTKEIDIIGIVKQILENKKKARYCFCSICSVRSCCCIKYSQTIHNKCRTCSRNVRFQQITWKHFKYGIYGRYRFRR